MKKIASFCVDHTILKRGFYVSRKDMFEGVAVTTFDLRFTQPNVEPPMDMAAVHTIEHLGATYLRNSDIADQVIYFGPMGCRTGFYLVVFGDVSSQDAFFLVEEVCDFILNFSGDIPGATPAECGNYLEQNLAMAKFYTLRYLEDMRANGRFTYPAVNDEVVAPSIDEEITVADETVLEKPIVDEASLLNENEENAVDETIDSSSDEAELEAPSASAETPAELGEEGSEFDVESSNSTSPTEDSVEISPEHYLDLLFAVDTSVGMENLLPKVKQHIPHAIETIINNMQADGNIVKQVRCKLIAFSNFVDCGADAISQTPFFTFPEQRPIFERILNSMFIDASAGKLSNGLEALWKAIDSDWVPLNGRNGRHIIVLISNSLPLHLHECDGSLGYDADDFPAGISELSCVWNANEGEAISKISPTNKRLILLVPDGVDEHGHSWQEIRCLEFAGGAVLSDEDNWDDFDECYN